MAYNRDHALEFWYTFDQAFLFNTSPEVQSLYAAIYGPDNFSFDVMVDRVRDHSDPTSLSAQLKGREKGILRLAELQVDIIHRFFPDADDLRQAFEDFGQGILYDAKPDPNEPSRHRRPQGRIIHMMDGSPDECVGYHRWHAFIRAASAVGADSAKWLSINRFVGLAWAIYSELNPAVDAPDNPSIAANRLADLRDAWLKLDAAGLSKAFLNYRGKFPTDYGSRRAPNSASIAWLRVQRILIDSAIGSNPHHGGHGRFWELPLRDFLSIEVYGQRIIAPPGPTRGGRSALVKALRGQLPGYPRMPMNRPAVNEADIQFIQDWIDDLPDPGT